MRSVLDVTECPVQAHTQAVSPQGRLTVLPPPQSLPSAEGTVVRDIPVVPRLHATASDLRAGITSTLLLTLFPSPSDPASWHRDPAHPGETHEPS